MDAHGRNSPLHALTMAAQYWQQPERSLQFAFPLAHHVYKSMCVCVYCVWYVSVSVLHSPRNTHSKRTSFAEHCVHHNHSPTIQMRTHTQEHTHRYVPQHTLAPGRGRTGSTATSREFPLGDNFPKDLPQYPNTHALESFPLWFCFARFLLEAAEL